MRKVNPAGVWNLALEKQIVLFPFSFQIYVFKIYGYVAFPADLIKNEQNSQ